MIRVTVKTLLKSETYTFLKSTILIGGMESSDIDLPLPVANLQPVHVKIIEQQGMIQAINVANDPFISINGYPFGKQFLRSGDRLFIHEIEITIEHLASEQPKPLISSLPCESSASPSKEKESRPISSESPLFDFSIPFESEVDLLPDQELSAFDVDQYLQDLEKQKNLQTNPQDKTIQKKSSSLKDDYLKDLDDDSQHPVNFDSSSQNVNHLYQAWRWILFFIFSLITTSAIIGTVLYLSLSDKTEAQETKVAQGMADIGMALIHAQTNHVKPHNQNWSDIEFLKNNLQSILPQVSSYAAEIDSKGQFTFGPYSLRIYTSNDLLRFLIIAQPAPSFLHWLIPKSAIIIDSQAMEIRTLKNLRQLNRLLANSDPLEGLNGKEISALLEEGDLVELATLANESGHADFAPPQDVKDCQPGAENLIYNAPRYYRLGQLLVQKATLLATAKGSSQEVTALRQMIEQFSCLNHWVVYAEQGKKSAAIVRQGLNTFATTDKMLFGYLTLNAQGKIHQAHLLPLEEPLEALPAIAVKEEDNTLALATKEGQPSDVKLNKTSDHQAKTVDINHPLYIQLQTLSRTREQELQPLGSALDQLLQSHAKQPQPNFQVQFEKLSQQYLEIDAKRKEIMKISLRDLYHQYGDLPINQFVLFIKEAGLEDFIANEPSLSFDDHFCKQNLENMLTHIENSKNLVDLDHLIQMANSWLSFEHIQNPRDLLKYQSLIRNKILQQLEKFLIYYRKYPFLSTLKTQDKEFLEHILNCEGIIRPEERDFFLEEFDYLIAEDHLESFDPIRK